MYLSYQMDQMTEQERQEYREENRQRIESIQEESLNLGLDLQGGMHVTLEVQMASRIEQLAINIDESFRQALNAAQKRTQEGDVSFVNAFVQEFESRSPNGRLSRYFRNESEGITRRSSNDEVQEYLQTQASDAVDQAMQIVRNRVDRYGVTEPSIQKQGTRRIAVELPGVDEPERVRSLLESASQLTFHLMGDPQQLQASVQRIIEYYEPSAADTAQIAEAGATDTTAQADTSEATQGTALATGGPDQQGTSLSEPGGEQSAGPQNPLLAVMQPLPRQGSTVVGHVLESDTARVNELLADSRVQDLIPTGVDFLWGARNIAPEGQEPMYQLLGVQEDAELTGDVITQASVTFDQQTNQPAVSMTMNSEGARSWGRLTRANVGEQFAIVLDDVVYSNPVVEEPITGGRSSIDGLNSRQEAQDIVTILRSGSLPAPVNIISERTVGPSLGEESIRAGLISVIVGLLLVVLFMIMYYRTAGIVADIALLLNVILILGILAGFGATLTLPGIAGIVLTIGMAVDANVLIYDRVREEQSTGKTLRAAIAAGYEQSLSAILDANITTFFVGVILYSFGVGPIQGFAVTLMAGILSSLFTAIIVTRLIFDYMVEERSMEISYG
jgi:preprotein translocase subunit SecD